MRPILAALLPALLGCTPLPPSPALAPAHVSGSGTRVTSPSARRGDVVDDARDLLEEAIDTDTSTAVGSGKLAERLATRFRGVGFPAGDVVLAGPRPANQNLVVRLRGAPGGRLKPLLFIAHLDVVPALRADWSTDPFKLVEKDGFFYGRGVQDMKEEVAEIAANFIRFKKEGFVPNRDLIVAFTEHEEGGDDNGVEWLLANRRDLIDAELAINLEGGGGDLIKGAHAMVEIERAEKGYLTVVLEVRNPGGHSSMPTHENAIYRLAHALERVAALEFPLRTNEVTRAFFANAARGETGDAAKDLKGVGAEPMDPAAAARVAASSSYFNAMLRTTCVATMLQAGHAPNALPQTARATINCRLLPDESVDSVEAALRAAIGDPQVALSRETWLKTSSVTPDAAVIKGAVEKISSAMWPGIVVTPVQATGISDANTLRAAGIPVYGVSGMFIDIDDVRAHGKDENLGIGAYYEGLEFMRRFVRAVAAP